MQSETGAGIVVPTQQRETEASVSVGTAWPPHPPGPHTRREGRDDPAVLGLIQQLDLVMSTSQKGPQRQWSLLSCCRQGNTQERQGVLCCSYSVFERIPNPGSGPAVQSGKDVETDGGHSWGSSSWRNWPLPGPQ